MNVKQQIKKVLGLAHLLRYIMGHDTYSRHRIAGHLLRKHEHASILDVGGEGLLGLFLDGGDITTANISNSDIVCLGQALPFHNDAFDLVLSLDTMEHIPVMARKGFLDELHRVSKRALVVCAPYGTSEHRQWEKAMLESSEYNPAIGRYLKEHVEYGLPDESEITAWMQAYPGSKIAYHGDYRAVLFPKNIILRYLALSRDIMKNIAFGHRLETRITASHSVYTNRFFLLIPKRSSQQRDVA